MVGYIACRAVEDMDDAIVIKANENLARRCECGNSV